MRRSPFLFGLALSTVVAGCIVAGCSEDRSSSATSEADQTSETTTLSPLTAPVWTRCWVDRTDINSPLSSVVCRYDRPRDGQPLQPKLMSLELQDGAGVRGTAVLVDRPGEDVLVAQVETSAFPLRLSLSVWTDVADTLDLAGVVLTATMRLENGDSNPKDRAIEFKQPFDLWPVVVVSKVLAARVQMDPPRLISIAPWQFSKAPLFSPQEGYPTSERAFGGGFLARGNAPIAFHYLIPPTEGAIGAKYTAYTSSGAHTVDATFDGPGVYVGDETGLRKATDEEARLALLNVAPPSDAPDGSSDSASQSDTSQSDASTPPSAP